MVQHGTSKVIGGGQVRLGGVGRPGAQPEVAVAGYGDPLDKDSNVSGPPKVVARGAEATQKDAEHAAGQWINGRVNPKA